ncbi:MAG: hypothetical protein CMO81_06240 [Waddliaceae bacterium]|nr:hypothetical protein [Waddliaceae bacterium]
MFLPWFSFYCLIQIKPKLGKGKHRVKTSYYISQTCVEKENLSNCKKPLGGHCEQENYHLNCSSFCVCLWTTAQGFKEGKIVDKSLK